MGAADYIFFRTTIEGWRWARLGFGFANAQPVTIGFWIFSLYIAASNSSGIVTVGVKSFDNTRTYFATVTINNVATWEYKTVTIPGDVAGTWNKTNGAGAFISIVLGCGTTYGGAASGAWLPSSSALFAAAGQDNLFRAGAATQVAITGLTVHPGAQGPTAAQSMNLSRPFMAELPLCQRYWYNFPSGSFFGAGTVRGSGGVYWSPLVMPTIMRANPTVGLGTGVAVFSGDTNGAVTSMNATLVSNGTMALGPVFSSTGMTNGVMATIYTGSGTGVTFDARI
jgi:hypothetical protein